MDAADRGKVLPIYILDDEAAGVDAMGAASRVWLHHSLTALDETLGGKLAVFKGRAQDVLARLMAEHDIDAVYWNRCYEPWRIARDREIKAWLGDEGIEAHRFNGSLLWEPWEVHKADGAPYRVFTPFYRKGCLSAPPPREPLPAPDLHLVEANSDNLDALALLPEIAWDQPMLTDWEIGEAGAQKRLHEFLGHGLSQYKIGRNYPDQPHVSRLSPHLHFGEISPNQAWYAVRGHDENADCFKSELGWREFSYSLLYNFPELRRRNWNEKFDAFPWRNDERDLQAWQKGQTGIPIVDAGMRELWQTGYMHNRVRMIVASFLCKNLRVDWREGEQWFWDTLFDADHASNGASWQWVAGSGVDAAPYFRIFNPVLQSEKFDPKGDYIRRFVPELARLDAKSIHAPWQAKPEQLVGLRLGIDYPHPIADLKQSRALALAAYQDLSSE